MNNEVKRFINESSNYDVIDYINNLQQIEKEHQKLNGELRKENQRLNNIINELENTRKEAIEYIKEDMYGEPNELYGLVDGEHLLNILNKVGEE